MRHKVKRALKLVILVMLAVFSSYTVQAQTWTKVNTDGFGDPNNTLIRSMSVFDGNLYAGTMNATTGCEVWKYDGTNWTQVNTDGFGNPDNTFASSMKAGLGGL